MKNQLWLFIVSLATFGSDVMADSSVHFMPHSPLWETDFGSLEGFPRGTAALDLIVDGFSRAFDQDLISIDIEQSSERVSTAMPSSGSGRHVAGVSASTAAERALAKTRADAYLPTDPTRCLGVEHYASTDVLDGADPVATLSAVRSEATDEAGRLTDVGRLHIAKTYVALGLGFEALAIATRRQTTDNKAIVAAARVMEGLETEFFSSQIGCSTYADMFAILSSPTPDDIRRIDIKAVLVAFSGFPNHLQKQIGPRLIKIFVKSGHHEDARVIVNHIKLSHSDVGRSALLAGLPLIQDVTSYQPALATTEPLTTSTDVIAAKAALEELRRNMPRDAVFDLAAMEALSLATSDSEVSRALFYETLKKRITDKDLNGASERLRNDRYQRLLTKDSRRDVIQRLWVAAALSDDETLLRISYAVTEIEVLQDLEPVKKSDIAKRLISVGRLDLAEKVIAELGMAESAAIVHAKLKMAQGLPDSARLHLESTDRPPAFFAGTVWQALKDYSTAADYFRNAGETEIADLASLASGSWSDVQSNSAISRIGNASGADVPSLNADKLRSARTVRAAIEQGLADLKSLAQN